MSPEDVDKIRKCHYRDEGPAEVPQDHGDWPADNDSLFNSRVHSNTILKARSRLQLHDVAGEKKPRPGFAYLAHKAFIRPCQDAIVLNGDVEP